jgi:hypothetical protein
LTGALILARVLEEALAPVGFHVGLIGSVLIKGQSSNDLDLVLFPNSTAKIDVLEVWQQLHKAGLRPVKTRAQVARAWEYSGSRDAKHVEVWMYQNRRVDLFFMR